MSQIINRDSGHGRAAVLVENNPEDEAGIEGHSHVGNIDSSELSELVDPSQVLISSPTIRPRNDGGGISKRQVVVQLVTTSPLLDISELQKELESMKIRASLCPSKFRYTGISNKANFG